LVTIVVVMVLSTTASTTASDLAIMMIAASSIECGAREYPWPALLAGTIMKMTTIDARIGRQGPLIKDTSIISIATLVSPLRRLILALMGDMAFAGLGAESLDSRS
jgi:hypothetical protein